MIRTNKKNNKMVFTVTIKAHNNRRLGRQELRQLVEELQDAVLNVLFHQHINFEGKADLFSPSIAEYYEKVRGEENDNPDDKTAKS